MSGLSLGEQPRLNMASTKGRFENEVWVQSHILLPEETKSSTGQVVLVLYKRGVAGLLRLTVNSNEHSDTYTATLPL